MKYVSYLRVSTKVQGNSGLGLEAQRTAVTNYVKGEDSIIAEYVEIASGKNNNRVQLAAAILFAKKNKAVLLIAKLDRLSRNASFMMGLRDTGVDFQSIDIPEANTLTVGLLATIAQHEREVTSARTIAALAAKKKRGESMGTPANLTNEARAKGTAAIKANAANAKENVQASELINLLTGKGLTLAAIAERLNLRGFRTRRGCLFTPTAVRRLMVP